jgi:hypothetical protein
MSETKQDRLESLLKISSPLLAVAVFFWGIYTYRDTAEKSAEREIAEAKRAAETRRIEATRPYLDKQLTLYTEATKVTATIATSPDPLEVKRATKRFRELYWGELALVERDSVAKAMVAFRVALDAGSMQALLAPLALDLAHACRDELALSWGTEAWKR